MLKYVHIRGFLDVPDKRKIHVNTVPRFGGIPFSLVVLVLFMICVQFDKSYSWYVFSSFIIIMVGLLDDVYRISWRVKLFVQLSLGGLIFTQFLELLPVVTFFGFSLSLSSTGLFCVFMIWFLGMVNSVNLIDGMDGLAGGAFFIIALGAAYLGWGSGHYEFLMFNLILAGALLGFLFFNGRPAKFFMGDTGSLFLGFTLAILPLLFHTKNMYPNFVLNITPFVVMSSYFVVDTLRVFVSRVLSKQNPLTPDNRHLHHELLTSTTSYNATLLVIYLLILVSVLYAISLFQFDYGFIDMVCYLILLGFFVLFPFTKLWVLSLAKRSVIFGRKLVKRSNRSISLFVKRALIVFFVLYYICIFILASVDLVKIISVPYLILFFMVPFILYGCLYKTWLSKKIFILLLVANQFFLLTVTGSTVAIDSMNYFIAFKFIVLGILMVGIMVYIFRNIMLYLLRFWVVDDLLFLVLAIMCILMSAFHFSVPSVFPTYTMILEFTVVYFFLRILVISPKHS